MDPITLEQDVLDRRPALKALIEEHAKKCAESQALLGLATPTDDDYAKAATLTKEIKSIETNIMSMVELDKVVVTGLIRQNGPADAGLKTILGKPSDGTDVIAFKEETPGMKMYRLIEQSGDEKLTPKKWKKTFEDDYMRGIRGYIKARGRLDNMSEIDRKSIAEGFDGEGGYLVPADIAMRLIERKPTPTRINSYVDTMNTGRDMVIVPRASYDPTDGSEEIYTSPLRFKWTGEKPLTSTEHRMVDPQWGNLEIPIYTAMGSILLTNNMIEDAVFDINAWLTRKIMETLDILYDDVILNGTGVGMPEGILRAPGTAQNPAVVPLGNPMSPDGIISLAYSLPEQYDENARFAFKKTTTGRDIALMKDLNDRYLFGAGLQDSGLSVRRPTELVGYPFAYSHLAPNASDKVTKAPVANAYPIVFGDWSGYLKCQRLAISMQVLDQVYAELNMVAVVIRIRFGGKIVEPWKFYVGQVA